MEQKNDNKFRLISLIFLIVFIASFLFVILLEINYSKNKDKIKNTVKISEENCLVTNKKSENHGVNRKNYYYYLFIDCSGKKYKIKISSDEFHNGNYFIDNYYNFYTENGTEFYTTKEKLLKSYDPTILFFYPFITFLLYLIYLEKSKKINISNKCIKLRKKENSENVKNMNIQNFEEINLKKRNKKNNNYMILTIIFAFLTLFSIFMFIYKENTFDESKITTGNCRVYDKRENGNGSYDIVLYPVEVFKIKNDIINVTKEEAERYKIGEVYKFYTINHKNYYEDKEALKGAKVTGGYAFLGLISIICFFVFFNQYKKSKKY